MFKGMCVKTIAYVSRRGNLSFSQGIALNDNEFYSSAM